MNNHFFVDVLSENECKEYANIIDSLSPEWIKREQDYSHLYTLGTATHADIESNKSIDGNTLDAIKHNNDLLKKNFPDLYAKVLKAIESKLGPCELVIDKAPIPGFFIYGEPKPNNIEKKELPPVAGLARIHFDGQVSSLDHIWNQYSDVDSESISYTLPIEMPEYGAAFLLWDQPDFGCYMEGEIADIYKAYDYYEEEANIEYLESHIFNKVPEVIEHIPGRMIVHKGRQLHAAAGSIKQFSTDRRITLQGLGVKCDGVWRLFF